MPARTTRGLDLSVPPDRPGAAEEYCQLYELWRNLDAQIAAGGMPRPEFRAWDQKVRRFLHGHELDVLMRPHPSHDPISSETEQIARHFNLRRLLLARKGADTLP